MNQKKETIKINHLELASVLMSLNYKLLDIIKEDPKRVVFCFDVKDEINDAVQKYFNSELRIDPKILFINLRGLKNLIYNKY